MGFGKDKKGVIFRQIDTIVLLTLASGVVVKQNNPPAMTDSFRMLKSEGTAQMLGATFVQDDGPVDIWLASDDLSEAEIAIVFGDTAGFPLSRGDIGGSDAAMRPVFYLGTLDFVPGNLGQKVVMEWSRTIRWTFDDSAGFVIVAVNRGSGALTTGGQVGLQHTAFGVWVGA